MSVPEVSQPSGVGERPRVVWVTNVSAPYRHPVWAAIADEANLAVGLLADNEPNRRWSSELPSGVERVSLRAWRWHRGDFHAYLLLRPALASRADVVVLPGWETPAAWQLLVEAKLRRLRTVAFYESATTSHRYSGGLVAAARRRFFRSVDAVITVGAASEAAVLSFGVDPAKVVTTYNSVDVEAIRQAVRATGPSRTGRADRFVYVGQLIGRKNVAALIDAFGRLSASSHLVVAGEGPEEATLRSLAAERGIADRVEFIGYVPYSAVPEVLADAATLILPSRTEVYGLVVVEALAAGLHVVVTEECGVFADVKNLRGVFAAEPTPVSLTSAMERSAASWSGPLEQPAVLSRTPRAMADDVLWACLVARSSG